MIHVGPDALVRVGERSSPRFGLGGKTPCRASPGRAGEGARPYVVRDSPGRRFHAQGLN